MIFYFTALVITYTIGVNEVNTVVWYEKEQHCREAMDDRLGDALYNQLYELYGNDIMMSCEVSDKVSYVLRPRLREDGRQALGSWQ
jgi:hypothetical protein